MKKTFPKKGRHNLSKQENQIILKRKLFFQEVQNKNLHEMIDELQKDKKTMRHAPRFIIVTDYETLLAMDTKTKKQLDIKIKNIAKHYDFFLPWAGIEKHKHTNENPADRKAAEKMAKLYDGILADNQISDEKRTHALNIFLSRLLFCFFAEDTNIFEDGIFTNSVASHTQVDGSDLGEYLDKLFDALNTENKSNFPAHFQKFPYVNGGLFAKKHWIPKFSTKARKIIIECGELDWKKINPDIFGSMIQAVIHPSERGSLGIHYTSVPNIKKVIEPLFLNELKEEFEKYKGNKNKLKKILGRISRMKFFDPACGSGNFLIIAYKEIRRLQMQILLKINAAAYPKILLSNFYGIEIDDFAHEIAKLSLYLAEHQINIEFEKQSLKIDPILPLKESGNIFCENALRVDWGKICPKDKDDEIFVFGNPPYLGARNQDKEQKEDMKLSVGHLKGFNNLDYISCWFYLAAKYIENSKAKFAFVSTNSICQGSQVALLWPHVLGDNLEIFFAHQSFKWTNNAKGNAGVTCVIVGVRNFSKNEQKLIFKDGISQMAKNINGYILNADDVYIEGRKNALSKIPPVNYGSFALDDGNYTLNKDEAEKIKNSHQNAHKFVLPFVGAKELIGGIERYCLWIENKNLNKAETITLIKNRIEKVRKWREKSERTGTKKLAKMPHIFAEIRQPQTTYLAFPTVSSERRVYIPIQFLESNTIASNQIYVIPTSEPWIFGVISSRMHMVWVRAVAGRLKTDYRYSSALCYNTFPIPPLTTKQKETLTRHVYTILEEREKHSEKTMAQLYDPDKMPTDLLEAHQSLDLAVDRIYRSREFESDKERLEYLFGLYERMVKEENLAK